MRAALPENSTVPAARPGEFAPLALGPLAVWPPIVLAPMAGVTNYPFRAHLPRVRRGRLRLRDDHRARLPRGQRAARGCSRRAGPTRRPRSVQIYGHDPAEVGEMAPRARRRGRRAPRHELRLSGAEGDAARRRQRDPGEAAAAGAHRPRGGARARGGVPVTIKVRKGIDDALLTYLDAGRVAEAEGAARSGCTPAPRRSSTRATPTGTPSRR